MRKILVIFSLFLISCGVYWETPNGFVTVFEGQAVKLKNSYKECYSSPKYVNFDLCFGDCVNNFLGYYFTLSESQLINAKSIFFEKAFDESESLLFIGSMRGSVFEGMISIVRKDPYNPSLAYCLDDFSFQGVLKY